MNAEVPVELVEIENLKPHPRNYRAHPEDQIEHIMASIREHGIYRNVVVARDGTILAGHGVVEAVKKMGGTHVPIKRLDLDPLEPLALKVLAGDNEISRLGEIDDRMLSELLKEIKDQGALIGTGYDEMMLANLLMVTRPRSEIKDMDAAMHWVGMPEYETGSTDKEVYLVVEFQDEAARDEFVEKSGAQVHIRGGETRKTWSASWPEKRTNDDRKAIKFEQES